MAKKSSVMRVIQGERPVPEKKVLAAEADEQPIRVARHRPRERKDPRLVLMLDPDTASAARYRVLRQRLWHKGQPHVIAISSAVRGEGRTTCAFNLAAALAEDAENQVLLCDIDVRSPGVARLLGFDPPWCFADQLKAHRSRPAECWSVVRIDPIGLHVAAVKPGTGRRRVDDGPELGRALCRFREVFTHVVIDAPPILESAEVNALETIADGVVVVARAGRTRGRPLRRALEQIGTGPLLGVVLLE